MRGTKPGLSNVASSKPSAANPQPGEWPATPASSERARNREPGRQLEHDIDQRHAGAG